VAPDVTYDPVIKLRSGRSLKGEAAVVERGVFGIIVVGTIECRRSCRQLGLTRCESSRRYSRQDVAAKASSPRHRGIICVDRSVGQPGGMRN
jgi:hypothetical protein